MIVLDTMGRDPLPYLRRMDHCPVSSWTELPTTLLTHSITSLSGIVLQTSCLRESPTLSLKIGNPGWYGESRSGVTRRPRSGGPVQFSMDSTLSTGQTRDRLSTSENRKVFHKPQRSDPRRGLSWGHNPWRYPSSGLWKDSRPRRLVLIP